MLWTADGSSRCLTYGAFYGVCMSFGGASWLGCWLRGRVRDRLGIQGSPVQDWWIHCCCPACALCQEFSTMHARLDNFVRPSCPLLALRLRKLLHSSAKQQVCPQGVAETLKATAQAAQDTKEGLMSVPEGDEGGGGAKAQQMERGGGKAAPPPPAAP